MQPPGWHTNKLGYSSKFRQARMMRSGRIGEERNYTGYCDKEVDALIDRQSSEPDPEKRRQLMWEIERRLARDASRPIIFYTRAATCWRPRVKGLNLVVNSVFNGWRFEDVWIDR
jgi:peptide/nickel transport system substrate-binding protein